MAMATPVWVVECLTRDNQKVVWAKFSALSHAKLIVTTGHDVSGILDNFCVKIVDIILLKNMKKLLKSQAYF
jgi:hypothetical protein